MKKFRLQSIIMMMLFALALGFFTVDTASAQTDEGECVIPESGPWPDCATGGEPPDLGDDCVIPDSGPWPPCATGGEETSPGDGDGDADGGDDDMMPVEDFPSGEPRVDLEVEVDGEKVTVGIAPALVPFDGQFYAGVSIIATELAKEGRSALGGLGDGNPDGCDNFEDLYLSVIAAPIFVDVPSEYSGQVAVYEAGIQKIGDGARDFFLYCYNGGGFSDLSYFLATSGYDEGINILERAAMDAVATFGTPDAPVEPPAPEPTDPEDPAPEDPMVPEQPAPEDPAPMPPPMDGGGDRPEELADLFPGAELYFGNNYPLADSRVTLFLNNSSGANEAVDFPVNVVPFNGDNFTTVMLWTTTFVDLSRTDYLPTMSGGSADNCDEFFAAYLIVAHSPQFDATPGEYQPWVNQYNDGVQQFLNGARDIAQWCFNGGAFPQNAYQPAVDAATNAFNTLVPIADAAIDEFGIPEALQFASTPSTSSLTLSSVMTYRGITFTVRAVPATIY